MRPIAIDKDVMVVLSEATMAGKTLVLNGQLDRELYVRTDKVLKSIGGKWNRKARAHVFDGPAIDIIEPVLLTGAYTRAKQDFGQFDSPPDVAERVVDLAEILPAMLVLEPSVGIGNLALAAEQRGAAVEAIEIDTKRGAAARDRCAFTGGGLRLRDFLATAPEPTFHRVVMNPPFARQADIDHVVHAAKFLRPGGRLVSVMSNGMTFRRDRKTIEFREYLSRRGGIVSPLDGGSFLAAGTSVNAVLVWFYA